MSTSEDNVRRKGRILSREHVKELINDGQTIIIVDGYALRVDAWLRYHPGGDKAIMHMVGREATDEVNAYVILVTLYMVYVLTHSRLHSSGARRKMNNYRIGRIEGNWLNYIPPIQGGKFDKLSQENAVVAAKSDSLNDSDVSDDCSGTSTPLFDPPEDVSTIARNRSKYHSYGSNSSTTSLSSVDIEDVNAKLKPDYLESHTQHQIAFDLKKYPSLDSTTQDEIVQKYRLLNERIQKEGLYNCPFSAYAVEILRYGLLFTVFLFSLHCGYYALAGAFLGVFWHQLVFAAHDAGHMGITHDFTTDTAIGIFIADFLGGLSLGWWKQNHNVHHIVTNSPEHDPDIEHMPFFAISHRFFNSLRSTYYDRTMTFDAAASFLVRYQHLLYYPVLTLGRFNLYRLSWAYLLLGQGPRKGPAWWHRWFEILGHIFFWTWFGYGVLYLSIPTFWSRFIFVMVSHGITMPLHVQITLSHFAMSTADLGVNESFPQKMLRTTMDIDCPPWLDFFHGGLQFQAVHHLFPRIPRHNLRRTQKLVREFCEEVKIPYALYGFVDGNKEVLGRLGEVGKQAAILAECQRTVSSSPAKMHLT